ncbi:hypothetical protein [Sphingomonas sp.]|uniref:hypothetical protein n=1 Tax=Sphingomonas sp. TaxID=28214 RepID=UPI001EC23FF5|nr:hypothetical protein [Sphingomonas sp.]MBX3593925.1 hypothetical protein [Sphingomonas sp.]
MTDRTETARNHDGGDLIASPLDTPGRQGRNGGNLARDVGTDAATERVRDPEACEGVDRRDEINHGECKPG